MDKIGGIDNFNFCLRQKCHGNFLKRLLYVVKTGYSGFRIHGLVTSLNLGVINSSQTQGKTNTNNT
jgi:hypothetical protein